MHSIAESGMLYAVTVFIVLICQATNSLFALIPANAVVRLCLCHIVVSLVDKESQGNGHRWHHFQSHSHPRETMW